MRRGMQMLIEEQTEVKRRDHTLLEKYTDLDDNIKKLKEETGRDVTIEELSAFLICRRKRSMTSSISENNSQI